MKRSVRATWVPLVTTVGIAVLALFCTEAMAAEEPNGWRPVYDLVMRWLNFLIFAFIIVKYTRVPLKNFLRGKKEEITSEIDLLEGKKKEAASKIRQARKQLEDSGARYGDMKQRIIAQGQKNKQQILEDAKRESTLLLESAAMRIQSLVNQAKTQVKAELIDQAVKQAISRLPQLITEDDNSRLLNQYMDAVLRD